MAKSTITLPRPLLRGLLPLRNRIGAQSQRRMKPGEAPGTIAALAEAQPTLVHIMAYTAHTFEEICHVPVADLPKVRQRHGEDTFFWLDVQGFKDTELLKNIADHFGITALELEDAVQTDQRPKVEVTDGQVFAISRQIYFDKEGLLYNEQLTLCVRPKVLVTFQENYLDELNAVRDRLRKGENTAIRKRGPMYLAYALMDAIVDHYFPILKVLNERATEIEMEILENTARHHMLKLQVIRRQLAELRRAVVPERDKMDELRKLDIPGQEVQLHKYFRDVFDHTRQVIDQVDSTQEFVTSLMDLYMYGMGNRQNEVMKVLTMVSSIFIPLSFIAGVYGMNFMQEDPFTHRLLPLNMPELRLPGGYVTVIAIMALIAIGQLVYFYRKGWFRKF